jgi:hypothetical protein
LDFLNELHSLLLLLHLSIPSYSRGSGQSSQLICLE